MQKHLYRCGYELLEPRCMLDASSIHVDIPTDLTALYGETVTVPVEINDASGIAKAVLQIKYDTAILEVDGNDINTGTVWTQIESKSINVDEVNGVISITISQNSDITATEGTLASIAFTVKTGLTATSTTIDLQSVSLTDLYNNVFITDVTSAAGDDETDGLITLNSAPTVVDQSFYHRGKRRGRRYGRNRRRPRRPKRRFNVRHHLRQRRRHFRDQFDHRQDYRRRRLFDRL